MVISHAPRERNGVQIVWKVEVFARLEDVIEDRTQYDASNTGLDHSQPIRGDMTKCGHALEETLDAVGSMRGKVDVSRARASTDESCGHGVERAKYLVFLMGRK